VAVKASRKAPGPVSTEPTPPVVPTAVVIAVATPVLPPPVPTPLPTFTPTGAGAVATPTAVNEWWPTPTPVVVATTAPFVAPATLPPTVPPFVPPTAAPRPTEPPVVATFRCKKGVKFSLSPDSAVIDMDGVKIGTADDWDDFGGGKVWEFSGGSGVHFARVSLPGYEIMWVKIVVDPSASDEVADVDTDLTKEKKKK